jgi:hypothetical protein
VQKMLFSAKNPPRTSAEHVSYVDEVLLLHGGG